MLLPLLQNGFIPITQTKTSKYLQLPGQIGQFLEGYERNEYALVLRGSKGSDKSTFLFSLMDAFVSMG